MTSSHTPRRIACLQPSATVVLNDLGELGRVVACTKYCVDVVPEAGDGTRTILADSWTADATQIIGAKPDLVIASVPYQEKSVGEILKAGVPFLAFAPKNLSDIYKDITMIAGVIGENERGERLIAAMQKRIEEVRTKTAGLPRLKVFCEEWGKPIITSQKWVAELAEAAGGEFVTGPNAHISHEEVATLDPDIVIAAWCGAGDRVPLEKIISSRGWHEMKAASEGHIYCINDEFLNTPAPTLLHGLDALAWAIHPEIFPRPKGIRRITDVLASIVANQPA
jgi:iron complex transport system substrate-binding protein